MTSLAAALRAVRSGRDKSAFYRMLHLHQRAGLRGPDIVSPGAQAPFETALLALGEETGKMEEVLRLLADYFAAEDRMMQQVLKHATYPMFTALAATFIAPLPLLFFGRTGFYVVTVAGGLALWIMAGGGLVFGITRRFLNQPRFVLARLLRGLTIAVESGLGLDRAAVLAAQATGNDDVIRHVRAKAARERGTQPLSATFDGCPHVPFTAIAALRVAEASGNYTGTLVKLAELHDA